MSKKNWKLVTEKPECGYYLVLLDSGYCSVDFFNGERFQEPSYNVDAWCEIPNFDINIEGEENE